MLMGQAVPGLNDVDATWEESASMDTEVVFESEGPVNGSMVVFVYNPSPDTALTVAAFTQETLNDSAQLALLDTLAVSAGKAAQLVTPNVVGEKVRLVLTNDSARGRGILRSLPS